MKLVKNIFSAAICLLIFSCSKETPGCIDDRIDAFKKQTTCESAKVDKYKYEGTYYYAFVEETCCCDMQSIWYNEQCDTVCITGGIAPGVNECSIPVDSIEFVETVWEK